MVCSHPMPAELADLVRRVARHPHGLGFLHQAYLDSVAVTLGVHPFVVDAARAYLGTPEGRSELIEQVRREHQRPPADGPALEDEPGPSSLGDAERLIQAAARQSRGVGQLAEGPAEKAAERFGVHPYLVFRARGLLERRRRLERQNDGPVPLRE